MGLFLILAFLFFIGSVLGFVIELLFRRFISSANPERKWINPGFCVGPYIPLYGVGLCTLYLVAGLEKLPFAAHPVWGKLWLFLIMAVAMTLIEYLTGLFCLKVLKVRLWDYSREWANLQGIICPRFSLIWAVLGALYYFLIHPYILNALLWLSRNLAFSFVIGLFFGVFILDVIHSAQLVAKLKRLADEYRIVVRYEHLKAQIRRRHHSMKTPYHFFRPFHTDRPLSEYVKELQDHLEKRIRRKPDSKDKTDRP